MNYARRSFIELSQPPGDRNETPVAEHQEERPVTQTRTEHFMEGHSLDMRRIAVAIEAAGQSILRASKSFDEGDMIALTSDLLSIATHTQTAQVLSRVLAKEIAEFRNRKARSP